MSANLRAGAVSRTEDASGAAGGCFWHGTPLKMRRVPQEAVHSLWSRLFCGPLKMRRVPEKPVFGTEYLFRTVEACFYTECFRMRVAYHRRAFPVPSSFEGVGKGSAGDKFRVSGGTQETVEETGANKESGALTEASCCRCRTSNLSKQEAGQKEIFSRPLICYGLLRSVGLCG